MSYVAKDKRERTPEAITDGGRPVTAPLIARLAAHGDLHHESAALCAEAIDAIAYRDGLIDTLNGSLLGAAEMRRLDLVVIESLTKQLADLTAELAEAVGYGELVDAAYQALLDGQAS